MMSEAQIAARRKGAMSTNSKYDAATRKKWSASGGRPRNLYLHEIEDLRKLLRQVTGINMSPSALKRIWDEIKIERRKAN